MNNHEGPAGQTRQLRDTFFVLVDDVCQELGYPARSNRPEEDEVVAMEMDLDGYPFAVVHSLFTAPERVLVECRFGALPSAEPLDVMHRLLQLNYALADAGELIFGMEPDGGEIIFTRTCLLQKLNGRDLLGAMTQMAWQAAQWNKHRFLEGKQEAMPASSFPSDFGALA